MHAARAAVERLAARLALDPVKVAWGIHDIVNENMSGAMIKMGVYGLLRIGLDVLGGGPAWWGALVIGLGALSAVLGVLYALTEDDLKRLLAYSSVENIGVIALGVGAAFLFQSLQMLPAAAFSLAAALFHGRQ